jgi:hypothetical protein
MDGFGDMFSFLKSRRGKKGKKIDWTYAEQNPNDPDVDVWLRQQWDTGNPVVRIRVRKVKEMQTGNALDKFLGTTR